MIEVFKTNVDNQHEADMLVTKIQKTFSTYVVNFDLDDCDKILRIKCTTGAIKSFTVILLLQELGYYAEILPDKPVVVQPMMYIPGRFIESNQLN